MATTTELNHTNTHLEAWIDYVADYVARGTEKVNDLLTNEVVKKWFTDNLDKIVWGSPLLVAPLAPITFSASLILGGVTGFFSSNTMEKIFKNVDNILNGGVRENTERNTNFKLSLVFACLIASRFAPIPSLPMLYAGGAGFILGAKLSQWSPKVVTDKIVAVVRKIDPFVPRFADFTPKQD